MLGERIRLVTVLSAALLSVTAAFTSADTPAKPRTVAFLIWDNVELIEFTGPAQIFEFAPGFDGFTVAPTTQPIHSYFVTIVPQYSFANCPQPDVVVIPAGSQMMRSEELTAFLRRIVPKAEAVLTVCNGSLVLANTGLLDGQIATTPHANLDDLAILGKNIRPCANRRFVESGKFVTANSYFAGVDAALFLVAKLAGEQAARQSAARNLYDWRPQDFAGELADPIIVPPSRRRLMFDTLMKDGVDAALARYRQMLNDGQPKDAPASTIPDESRLRFLCWNLQNARRYDDALKLAQFSAAAFTESAMARACLGEAQFSAGRPADAMITLLGAAEMKGENGFAAGVLRRLLSTTPQQCGLPSGQRPITPEQSEQARRLIRKSAIRATVLMIPDGEPGIPLFISGLIRDGDGKPIDGAIVFAFQTDANGHYSDGLVAAPNGLHDDRHPRLFAFARTGPDGRYELRTIRPAAYSDAPDNPEHIHFAFAAKGYRSSRPRANINMYFADDPRLKGEAAEEIRSDKAHIVTPARDANGTQWCEYDFVLIRESPPPAPTTQAANTRIRVGMDLEDARQILLAHGAVATHYHLGPGRTDERLEFFHLTDGDVVRIVYSLSESERGKISRLSLRSYRGLVGHESYSAPFQDVVELELK